MKPFFAVALGCALAFAQAGCAAPAAESPTTSTPTETPKGTPKTMHSFKAKDISGKEIDLADYKGKTVLLVNTASRCGFTKQYDGLEKLYKANKEKGFVILGFPSNDFGGQEPGTEEEIATFCKAKFGVTFPLFSKITVKGENAHPLYKWLTSKEENPNFAGPIGWNFTKFLINKDGEIVARFASNDAPESDKVQSAVAQAIEGKK